MYKLQLADLVCEGPDEGVVHGNALWTALWVVEVGHQLVGQLVP